MCRPFLALAHRYISILTILRCRRILAPPRYLIDGAPVGAGEWYERSALAGRSSYVIKVIHADMERPE
jgi:hypothetical protein